MIRNEKGTQEERNSATTHNTLHRGQHHTELVSQIRSTTAHPSTLAIHSSIIVIRVLVAVEMAVQKHGHRVASNTTMVLYCTARGQPRVLVPAEMAVQKHGHRVASTNTMVLYCTAKR